MVAEKVEAALRLISKSSETLQLVHYPGFLAWAQAECRAVDRPINPFAVNPVVEGIGEIQSYQIVAGIGEPEETQDFRSSYSSLGGTHCVVIDLVQDDTNL